MEICGREVVHPFGVVAMLSVTEILVPYPDEGRVGGELPSEAVKRGRIPRDGGHNDESRLTKNASRLPQRCLAIGCGWQVIERAHYQHCIGKSILLRKRACIC